jgi:hypothetical protein
MMLPVVMKTWRNAGEGVPADYFEEEFEGKHFSVNYSGIPGHTPDANSIESNHRNSKRNHWGASRKLPVVMYLNNSLPVKYKNEG